MLKILSVVGARPNFMKVAPIAAEIARRSDRLSQLLVHTGQHYDEAMSGSFFRDLNLSPPDINLEVGSGSHAEQTARVMLAFEPVLLDHRPDWVVVVGDVNSTLATALVAAKLGIKVAHVEAGLRSFDWTMPEEINRVITDRISNLLLTPSAGADENLRKEGIDPSLIVRVGNVMIDTLFTQLASASSAVLDQLKLESGRFAVVTLHRPSNVDNVASLTSILGALGEIAWMMPVVFPVHPRTRARIEEFGIKVEDGVKLLEPLGYREFLGLWSKSLMVLTDSGGLQEETTALGISCLTLRENTERPVTISEGTNQLVGTDRARILAAARAVMEGGHGAGRVPELWDGRAAVRIVDALEARPLGTPASQPA